MATKADVQDALKSLKEITNNDRLTVETVGGSTYYLLDVRTSTLTNEERQSQVVMLGKTSGTVHAKLSELIQANWILKDITHAE